MIEFAIIEGASMWEHYEGGGLFMVASSGVIQRHEMALPTLQGQHMASYFGNRTIIALTAWAKAIEQGKRGTKKQDTWRYAPIFPNNFPRGRTGIYQVYTNHNSYKPNMQMAIANLMQLSVWHEQKPKCPIHVDGSWLKESYEFPEEAVFAIADQLPELSNLITLWL